jgi:hypothetical protein
MVGRVRAALLAAVVRKQYSVKVGECPRGGVADTGVVPEGTGAQGVDDRGCMMRDEGSGAAGGQDAASQCHGTVCAGPRLAGDCNKQLNASNASSCMMVLQVLQQQQSS